MQIKNDKQCEHATIEPGPNGEYKQLDIPVDGSPGLSLRVSRDGRKSWTLRYRRQSDGKQRRLSLGTYPDVSLKDARDKARRERSEVSEGVDPAGARQERRASDTVASLAEQWHAFKLRQGRSDNYMKDCGYRIGRLPADLMERKAREVKRLDITAALEAVVDRGAYETNVTHRLLSAIFKWALSEGHIELDPTAGVKKRFTEQARTRHFNDDEVRAFWFGIADVKATEASRIAMQLCLVTGQRPNEIVGITRADVTLDGLHPTMRITGERAKNGDEHVVPLPRIAVELLRRATEIAGSRDWLFPSPKGDGPITANALSKIIGRAGDADTQTLFGIPDAVLYDCKKTVATYLGNAGFTNEQVGRLLNHKSAKSGNITGKHYNHATYMPEKRKMIEQWARHLEGVIGVAREVETANVVALHAGGAI